MVSLISKQFFSAGCWTAATVSMKTAGRQSCRADSRSWGPSTSSGVNFFIRRRQVVNKIIHIYIYIYICLYGLYKSDQVHSSKSPLQIQNHNRMSFSSGGRSVEQTPLRRHFGLPEVVARSRLSTLACLKRLGHTPWGWSQGSKK